MVSETISDNTPNRSVLNHGAAAIQERCDNQTGRASPSGTLGQQIGETVLSTPGVSDPSSPGNNNNIISGADGGDNKIPTNSDASGALYGIPKQPPMVASDRRRGSYTGSNPHEEDDDDVDHSLHFSDLHEKEDDDADGSLHFSELFAPDEIANKVKRKKEKEEKKEKKQKTTPPRSSSPLRSGRSGAKIRFSNVHVRNYPQVLEVNPSVTSGPGIGLGWHYSPDDDETHSVRDWETAKKQLMKQRALGRTQSTSDFRGGEIKKGVHVISREDREDLLRSLGYTQRQIASAVRQIRATKNQRVQTIQNLNLQNMEEFAEGMAGKVKTLFFSCPVTKKSKAEQFYQGVDQSSFCSSSDSSSKPHASILVSSTA